MSYKCRPTWKCILITSTQYHVHKYVNDYEHTSVHPFHPFKSFKMNSFALLLWKVCYKIKHPESCFNCRTWIHIQLLNPVLFFIQLKLELLTKFPASNDKMMKK